MTLTGTRAVPTDLGRGVAAPTSVVEVKDPTGVTTKVLQAVSPDEVAEFLRHSPAGYQLVATVNEVTR